MKRISYYIAFILLLVSSGIKAQQVMTLEQCREMALENNKQIAIAARKGEKASADVLAYRANYLPKFSLSGNYLLSNASSKLSLPGGYLPTFVPNAEGTLVPNLVDGSSTSNPVFKQ